MIAVVQSAEQRKRARNVGIAYLVLAAVTLLLFTQRPGDAGFRLTETAVLTLPAQAFGYALGVILVAVAVALVTRS